MKSSKLKAIMMVLFNPHWILTINPDPVTATKSDICFSSTTNGMVYFSDTTKVEVKK